MPSRSLNDRNTYVELVSTGGLKIVRYLTQQSVSGFTFLYFDENNLTPSCFEKRRGGSKSSVKNVGVVVSKLGAQTPSMLEQMQYLLQSKTRGGGDKCLSMDSGAKELIYERCFPGADRLGERVIFQNKIYDSRRRVILAKRTAIRYCANNDAKLFNNRLVSQRFILPARSPAAA